MRCTGDSVFPDMPGGVADVVFHGVVDVSMITLVITFNSVVIVAILRYNHKAKSSDTFSSPNRASVRLVLSLAIIDLLAQLSIIYCMSFEYSCAIFESLGAHQVPCVARVVPFVATSCASMCNMVALALDRYIAIVHSLRYREIMTTRMTGVLILVTWSCGVATGIFIALWNNWTPGIRCEAYLIVPYYFVTIFSVSFAFLIFVLILSLHCLVHREALAARDRNISISSITNLSSLHRKRKSHNLNTKSAHFLYIILGCCVCLWSPIMTCVYLRLQGFNSMYLDMAYMYSMTLYNFMFFVNVFIYAWKNSTVKMAIVDLFGRTNSSPRNSLNNNSLKSVSVISDCTSTSSINTK